ncbi:MAG: hypothetical protein RSC84_03340 [Peptostreptococcaceae bacterium]
MTPLAKKIIDVISTEEDTIVLAEVLNFYEYLKDKKIKQANVIWDSIEEDDPEDDEIQIIKGHLESKDNATISLDDLSEDLGLNE